MSAILLAPFCVLGVASLWSPPDGPSPQPDQGDGIKTRLMNQACSKAATASGTLNMYFIPVALPSVSLRLPVGFLAGPPL